MAKPAPTPVPPPLDPPVTESKSSKSRAKMVAARAIEKADSRLREEQAASKLAERPIERVLPPALPPAVVVVSKPALAPVGAYSLAQLVSRYGDSSEIEVFSLIAADRTELAAMGSEIGAGRIDAECARLLGQAGEFFTASSPVQKRALRGFTLNFLRIAIWVARHSQLLWEQREQGLAEIQTRKAQRVQDADLLRKRAAAVREQWRALLRALSAGDIRRDTDIERAYGRAKEASELSRSLSALASLGRSYLADNVHASRARDAGLDTNFLAESERLASAVPAQIATSAAPREDAAVTQAEVDLWDGATLLLLECVLDLYEAAHALDSTVPTLLPMALRHGGALRPLLTAADLKPKPLLPPG